MPKIKYDKFVSDLQKLIKYTPSVTELANIIGITQNALSGRKSNNGYFSEKEQVKILNYYKHTNNSEYITIEHIGIKPECGNGLAVYDEPDIKPIRISADTITHYMRCSHPANLKAFTARGDSMRPLIDDGDTVLVDIGRTDIVNQGVFLFTSNNDWRIKRLNLKLNGILEVISDNPLYEKEFLSPNDEIEIIIKGRVILNLSKGL